MQMVPSFVDWGLARLSSGLGQASLLLSQATSSDVQPLQRNYTISTTMPLFGAGDVPHSCHFQAAAQDLYYTP